MTHAHNAYMPAQRKQGTFMRFQLDTDWRTGPVPRLKTASQIVITSKQWHPSVRLLLFIGGGVGAWRTFSVKLSALNV